MIEAATGVKGHYLQFLRDRTEFDWRFLTVGRAAGRAAEGFPRRSPFNVLGCCVSFMARAFRGLRAARGAQQCGENGDCERVFYPVRQTLP